MRSTESWLATVILTASMLSGCSPLAPRPDLSQFYLLTADTTPASPIAVVVSPASTPTGSARGVGLGPITFPEYLERAQLVTRVAPNQVRLSETDRWAEPIDANFTRVLSANLERLLPSNNFVAFPWSRRAAVDYQVRIEVSRFEADADGSAYLAARWTILNTHNGRLIFSDQSALSEPIRPAETGGQAGALSRLLARFSGQVAQTLRQLESPRPSSPGK
jgi:uncharacterized protein